MDKMKKYGMYILGISLFFILGGCSENKSRKMSSAEMISLGTETTETAMIRESDQKQTVKEHTVSLRDTQKIIKNVRFRAKVDSLYLRMATIKKIVRGAGGYFAEEHFEDNSYAKESKGVIRVPEASLEVVMSRINDLVLEIDYRNSKATDVTMEYIDAASRLKTKEAVRIRYEEILRGKAKTVEDVLMAEGKIGRLQEEIEVIKGNMLYWNDKTEYSTLELEVYEEIKEGVLSGKKQDTFWEDAREGIHFGWQGIRQVLLLLFYIWPGVVMAGLVIVYLKWIR
ncbi:DUF4349 domain-containing protein [Aquimarina hainanensis]|uniref:DUF4349 domain-containing protein n=1 Tax=Aquimarina hainanensis TaxID=1578017 RepID=A0ABW5N9V0_9FLAO